MTKEPGPSAPADPADPEPVGPSGNPEDEEMDEPSSESPVATKRSEGSDYQPSGDLANAESSSSDEDEGPKGRASTSDSDWGSDSDGSGRPRKRSGRQSKPRDDKWSKPRQETHMVRTEVIRLHRERWCTSEVTGDTSSLPPPMCVSPCDGCMYVVWCVWCGTRWFCVTCV